MGLQMADAFGYERVHKCFYHEKYRVPERRKQRRSARLFGNNQISPPLPWRCAIPYRLPLGEWWQGDGGRRRGCVGQTDQISWTPSKLSLQKATCWWEFMPRRISLRRQRSRSYWLTVCGKENHEPGQSTGPARFYPCGQGRRGHRGGGWVGLWRYDRKGPSGTAMMRNVTGGFFPAVHRAENEHSHRPGSCQNCQPRPRRPRWHRTVHQIRRPRGFESQRRLCLAARARPRRIPISLLKSRGSLLAARRGRGLVSDG